MTEKLRDRVAELGYTVAVAFEGYGGDRADGGVPTVYRVEGFDMSTQIAADDEDAWKRLTNAKAHEHAEKSARAADPEDEFEWSQEDAALSAIEVGLALGDISKEDAKAARQQIRDAAKAREEATA